MKKQEIIKKIGIFLLFLFLAMGLTYFGRFIVKMGEQTSSGYYVPGLPIAIYDLNSKGCSTDDMGWVLSGCQNLDFLLVFFVVDILSWIFLMYLVMFLIKTGYQRYKKSI